MRLIRKMASMRHFVVVSMLAVVLSIFSGGVGRAAAQSKSKDSSDPVISRMSWEAPDETQPGVPETDLGCNVDVGCNTDDGCVKNENCNAPAICNAGNCPIGCGG